MHHIRPAVMADTPAMLSIYTPYVQETTFSFEYEAPTMAEFVRRFVSITQKYPWLVWEEEGEIIGYAYASTMAERKAYWWSADISIYVRQDKRQNGIGRALYQAMESLLIGLGYYNLYAIITEENHASRAFHTSMGYTELMFLPRAGFKFGKWLGVYWYGKRLAEGIPETFPEAWDGKTDAALTL